MRTKKKSFRKITLLLYLLFLSISFYSQSEEIWENVTIDEFEEPYNKMKVSLDQEVFYLIVTKKTKFISGIRKTIQKSKVFSGSIVTVNFVVKNRKRVLTKVRVPKTDSNSGKFEGVFEELEDTVAYVDGRKVELSDNTKIVCKSSKSCNCSKGRSFIDFEEIPLGSFLQIDGKQNSLGIFIASKIEVCKNVFTKNDQQLLEEIYKSFDGSSLTNIDFNSNAAHSLQKRNIKVGSLSYKLLDNIKIQGYVNLVGNKVLPDYTKEEEFQKTHKVVFRFYVLDNEIPNAMAFPNGMIFINVGLLRIIENEAQLASLLGHEISHITYEHAADRFKVDKLSNSEAGNKVLGWLKRQVKKKAKIDDDNLLGSLSEKALEYVTPKNVMTLFDEKKEAQSDRVSLFYMHRSGYDVREAVRFWEIMSEKTKDQKFVSRVTDDAVNLFNSIDISSNGNVLENIGKKSSDILLTQLLETIYTSHPLSIKRLRSMKGILSTTYENVDFDRVFIGKEDFELYMSEL